MKVVLNKKWLRLIRRNYFVFLNLIFKQKIIKNSKKWIKPKPFLQFRRNNSRNGKKNLKLPTSALNQNYIAAK